MKVSLIDYTGKGMYARYAADLLVFTKSTRLKMSPDGLEAISSKSEEEIIEELSYMADTIPSSWEFINYTFLIEDCDRGFTHQLVRNRHGSYAQQTMRVLNVENFEYNCGPTVTNSPKSLKVYDDCMENINEAYQEMIFNGCKIEDARGVLPTNICTNIVVSFNLRTCAELISKRSSIRTQGAYRNFIFGMREEILKAHPFFDVFLENRKHRAADDLSELVEELCDTNEKIISANKLIDMLRG